MPTSKSQLISKEVAIVCAVVGILVVVITALVVVGLRNHQSRSGKLERTITDARQEVGLAPASLAPAAE